MIDKELGGATWWAVLPDERFQQMVADTLTNSPDLLAFEPFFDEQRRWRRSRALLGSPPLSLPPLMQGSPTPFVLPVAGSIKIRTRKSSDDPDTAQPRV